MADVTVMSKQFNITWLVSVRTLELSRTQKIQTETNLMREIGISVANTLLIS